MTTFQPGDVVRLTGGNWADGVRGTEATVARVTDSGVPVVVVNGLEMVCPEPHPTWDTSVTFERLSPQAVLDAILDSACPASDPDPKDWCAYVIESHCAEHTLTAREVDGHWQVKSVGGAE